MVPWKEIDLVECSPQSLLGYGLSAHKHSGGICLYCGMGKGVVSPEGRFDAWRQLTIEHIVPEATAGMAQIQAGVAIAWPCLTKEDQKKLANVVNDMNTVSCCHCCNTFAARIRSPETKQVRERFTGFLYSSAGIDRASTIAEADLRRWLEPIRNAIQEMWSLKAERVRGKLMHLRGRFRKEFASQVGVVLADERDAQEPDELDSLIGERALGIPR